MCSSGEIVYWVSENLQPFSIVSDCAFLCLMKTGQPELYIPSVPMVSHDVKKVFTLTCKQIAEALHISHLMLSRDQTTKAYQEYDDWINFATDAWTFPNHHAYVTFTAHLECGGQPLSFPLDVIKVPKARNLLCNVLMGCWHDGYSHTLGSSLPTHLQRF